MTDPAPADSGRIKLPRNATHVLFAAIVSLALGGGGGTWIGASALAVKADALSAKLDAQGAKLDELREAFLELRADRTANAATIADLKARIERVEGLVRALEIALAQKGK